MLPAVGTQQFRGLPFKSQLEIVSLQLFNSEEYGRAVGIPPKPLVEIELNYPDGVTAQPDIVDLPVSFADHHWAAYSCAFKPKWYSSESPGGCTPLDDFGVDYRKMVNVFVFNFALLSLTVPMYHLFNWVLRNRAQTADVDALVSACRVLLWLDLALRRPDFSGTFKRWRPEYPNGFKPNPSNIYHDAQIEFCDLYDYDELNGHCPTIQPCDSLLFWEFNDYVVHPIARPKNGRWYYPLLPSRLYAVNQFRIWNWDWLK